MDLDKIKEILNLMEERGLVEFEYEEDGKKIRIRKAESAGPSQTGQIDPSTSGGQIETVKPQMQQEVATPSNTIEFKSPMVGTFYRSPKPGVAPFVEVGDEVTPDKVICIIEAMKVMNEIKAQVSGIVKEILAKDGQAVEYAETLMLIEKK